MHQRSLGPEGDVKALGFYYLPSDRKYVHVILKFMFNRYNCIKNMKFLTKYVKKYDTIFCQHFPLNAWPDNNRHYPSSRARAKPINYRKIK